MRPSPLLLNNAQRVAAILREIIGPGRPSACPRCGRLFSNVPTRYERKAIAFIECPGCRAEIVYLRIT